MFACIYVCTMYVWCMYSYVCSCIHNLYVRTLSYILLCTCIRVCINACLYQRVKSRSFHDVQWVNSISLCINESRSKVVLTWRSLYNG